MLSPNTSYARALHPPQTSACPHEPHFPVSLEVSLRFSRKGEVAQMRENGVSLTSPQATWRKPQGWTTPVEDTNPNPVPARHPFVGTAPVSSRSIR